VRPGFNDKLVRWNNGVMEASEIGTKPNEEVGRSRLFPEESRQTLHQEVGTSTAHVRSCGEGMQSQCA